MSYAELDRMFYPKSIAVVGAKRPDPESDFAGMFGSIQEYGYKGHLYPINPKVSEIRGIKAYPNLSALPEPIDLIIVSVPAPAVPDVLRECAATGNKNVHIFTAGFKETGEPEALKLQKEIEEIANNNHLRVIGPNCMGICVPEIRVGTWTEPIKTVGPVSFLSQSGGHAQDFSNYAAKFGIGFSKIVSFGNALTLDSTDFLEYLADDPKTKIITMYLEGIKNGRKLLTLVKNINKTKPVIILKGGLTASGTKAVASHTGSMAGEEHFWNAFFKQTGAIRAYSLEDMAHTTLTLLRMGETKGRGVAVLGVGGGVVVAVSDACSKARLDLPTFPPRMQKSLRSFIPSAGNMIKNPLDAYPIFFDIEKSFPQTLDLIYNEPSIHMVIISLHMDWMDPKFVPKLASAMPDVCRDHLKDKPFVVCWRSTRHNSTFKNTGIKLEKELLEAGIPVYRSFEHAATSLSRLADYHFFQHQQEVLIEGFHLKADELKLAS